MRIQSFTAGWLGDSTRLKSRSKAPGASGIARASRSLRFIAVLAFVPPGAGMATGATCDITERSQAPSKLDLSPRRQWDCNYGSEVPGYDPGGPSSTDAATERASWHEHVNACRCPGNSTWRAAVRDLDDRWWQDRSIVDSDTGKEVAWTDLSRDDQREARQDLRDSFDCLDSCNGSPKPGNTDPEHAEESEFLDRKDCECGERQATLAGLCRPKAKSCFSNASQSELLQLNDNPAPQPPAKPRIPNCSGFCGSTSVQQSALHHGAYVSQGVIRRLVRKNDHYGALEILIDTDPGFKPDLYETVRLLGLEAERWYPSASSMGFCGDGRTDAEFLTWVENHIRSKNPVITGVFVGGEDASVTEYEHIVPIRGIDRSKGTLSINTNYSATPIDISTTPVRIGSGCPDSKAYCLASNRGTKEAPISPPTSWGVAVQPPSGQKLPVRIQVTGCSGGVCKLNGKAIPSEQNGIASKGWMEPNWTLRGIEPVSYELEATIENPNGQAQSGLRIARVDARTPEEIRALQAEGGPFGANAHSCYPAMASEGISVGAAETKKSVKQIDPVQSDRAAFFRVVTAQEATTVCPGINPLPEPTLRVAQCTGIPRSSCETPAAGAAERLELQSQAVDGKDTLRFELASLANTPVGVLGNPAAGSTDYRFCLYEGQEESQSLVAEAAIPAGGLCGSKDCWVSLGGDKGYRFRNKQTAGGKAVQTLRLRTGGRTGDASVKLKTRGVYFSNVSTPPASGRVITGQLVNSAGQCWSASESGS